MYRQASNNLKIQQDRQRAETGSC